MADHRSVEFLASFLQDNYSEQLKNIRAVFKCIRKAAMKLTIEKHHFRITQVELLDRTITPIGVALQDHKNHKLCGQNPLRKINKNASTEKHWLRILLKELRSTTVWKTLERLNY